jgi:protein involved in polysaccharide export with SLBB domain
MNPNKLTGLRPACVVFCLLAAASVAGCATGASSEAAQAKTEMDASSSGPLTPVAESNSVPMAKLPSFVVESTTMKTQILHNLPEKPDESVPTTTDWQKDVMALYERSDPASPGYKIGARDVLEFRSFDDPSLSTDLVVRFDGYVSLPLIPDILVGDRTRDEATNAIKDAFKKTVFKDPQISLVIRQSSSRYFTVMGDVMRPQEYPYARPITILEAINTAGGQRINNRSGDTFVGAQGQLTKAILIRHGEGGLNSEGGKRQVLEYNLEDLSTVGPHASDAPVYPGDIVYVPEGVNLIYLLGEVRAPSVYQLSQDMDVLQLLARAGGPNFSTAKLRQVVLMRELDSENSQIMIVDVKEMLKTGGRLRLRAGDVVYIPRKTMIRIQEFVNRFTGSISPVLSLYTQAYNAAYEAQRIRAALDISSGSNDVFQVLNLLQGAQNLLPVPTPTP